MRILKEKDLVTLEGNVKCLVIKVFEYNNENYGYLCNVTNLNEEEPQFVVVREIERDEECYLEILTDEDKLTPLVPIIKSLFSAEE